MTESPDIYRTSPDSYGVLREYLHGKPSITPDELYTITGVSDSPYLATDPEDSAPSTSIFLSPLQSLYRAATSTTQTFFAPFRNASIYRLMTWFYNSSNTKSMTELNSLVKDVILAPDFKPEDFVGFSPSKERGVMDSFQALHLLLSTILGSRELLKFRYHVMVSSNMKQKRRNFRWRSITERY